MINTFIFKKYAGLLFIGMFTTICFYSGLVMYNFIYALGFMAAGLGVSILIANLLLKNPFTSMLEGEGILALDINSTGIINPFILKVLPPFIEGKLYNSLASDVFDRNIVYNLTTPKQSGFAQQGEGKDGKIRTAIIVDEEEYNRSRFGLYQYPCVIYDSQIKSLVTKDFLSEQEKTSFAEHTILYLNHKVQQLTDAMLNFGRYVAESTKPRKSILSNSLVMIIIIIIIVGVLIYMIAPVIFPAIKGAVSTATKTSGAVIPK